VGDRRTDGVMWVESRTEKKQEKKVGGVE
jgi:hypothetical protein